MTKNALTFFSGSQVRRAAEKVEWKVTRPFTSPFFDSKVHQSATAITIDDVQLGPEILVNQARQNRVAGSKTRGGNRDLALFNIVEGFQPGVVPKPKSAGSRSQ
jgi:hypothetical protein